LTSSAARTPLSEPRHSRPTPPANNNTATGFAALFSNSGGNKNTATGTAALFANQNSDNTAVGAETLRTNFSGFANTGVGVHALYRLRRQLQHGGRPQRAVQQRYG